MPWQQFDDEEFPAAPSLAEQPETESEVDLDVPPAPDYGDDSPADEADDAVVADEQIAWQPSHGFPDGSHAVRVWGNEDGELVRVRVSPNWRERLRDSSLEHSFTICFALLNGTLTRPPMVPDPEPLPDLPSTDRLSWSFLDRLRREEAALEAELALLDDDDTDRWVGEQVCEADADKRVCLQLDVHGRPMTVSFARKWLTSAASASEISRAVMSAYRQARAKYTPPVPHYSERTLQARRRDQLNRKLLAAMRGGFET